MKAPIEQLEDCTNISISDGNWNVDPYMHGMANGLILALAIMKGEEPKYLDQPAQWLKDRPAPDAAASTPINEAAKLMEARNGN